MANLEHTTPPNILSIYLLLKLIAVIRSPRIAVWARARTTSNTPPTCTLMKSYNKGAIVRSPSHAAPPPSGITM